MAVQGVLPVQQAIQGESPADVVQGKDAVRIPCKTEAESHDGMAEEWSQGTLLCRGTNSGASDKGRNSESQTDYSALSRFHLALSEPGESLLLLLANINIEYNFLLKNASFVILLFLCLI